MFLRVVAETPVGGDFEFIEERRHTPRVILVFTEAIFDIVPICTNDTPLARIVLDGPSFAIESFRACL